MFSPPSLFYREGREEEKVCKAIKTVKDTVFAFLHRPQACTNERYREVRIIRKNHKFALLPRSFWTENIMQIGGVLEVILLSIALGVRINAEKQQRILMEQRLSSSLVKEVKERTLSLNQALEELEVANSILDKMSLTDSLTELANRRAFDSQFESDYQYACRNGTSLSLLLVDIDHFKIVNDTHGHQAGDQVLQAVAKALCSLATRPRDNVYRYGGRSLLWFSITQTLMVPGLSQKR